MFVQSPLEPEGIISKENHRKVKRPLKRRQRALFINMDTTVNEESAIPQFS